MDSGALGLQPLNPTTSDSSARQAPRKDLATRAGKSLRIVGRGVKSRWTPPAGSHADKSGRSKERISPIVGSKPLVPRNERMIGSRDGLRLGRNSDGDIPNITPDGGSAGREGRHFTVANVGKDGQIYLRPSVRPANQRYPQPHFVFPMTPPGTAGLDPLVHGDGDGDDKGDGSSEVYGSRFIPTPLTDASTLEMARQNVYFDYKSTPSNRHRRAMSDSTIQDVSMAQEEEAGAFKVVISKSQDEPKAKTAEDIDTDPNNLLQISIPSWKLGTPRFTLRGTPIIRGSSYAPTEDVRSSNLSFFHGAPREQNALRPEGLDSGKSSPLLTPRVQLPSPSLLSPSTIASPKFPLPMRSTYMSTHLVIEPAMFDSLTFKPACDDRSIVRYSPHSNAVTAATPPRLVAEITSPSFLDYELISDFFLTFRSYLETSDLLKMLIARLRWALSRDDETGMVVKVRTFVAIRHWILNYFVDDFVVDYQLRVTFCNLLNDFSDELSADQTGKKVPLKILGELKKCWRRVCAQYWDGPEFESSLGPEIPIAPGGIAGHRDPSLDPSFWESESDMPPQLYGIEIPDGDSQPDHSFYADVSRAGHLDSILLDGGRPSTPEGRPTRMERQQGSPTSVASVDVVSCSFPTKGLRMGDPNTSLGLGAHPVDPSSIYTYVDPIAPTPRALTGKRVHPHTSHRRNNSLTDSLREHGSLTERVLYKNAEFLLTLPYAGSLVRGNLLPPGQAIVDMDAPDSGRTSRMTTLFQPQLPASKQKTSASAMSGQGMKKLIGSVRRALSMRGQGFLPHQGGFLDLSALGPRGVTTNRLPGTAVVPEGTRLRETGSKQRLRIDMLGAEVAEDFQQAVREDAAEARAEDEAYGEGPAGDVEYSAAHLDSSFELRHDQDAPITPGSKSIVIVDGTMPEEHSIMSGAFRAVNPSVEAFAESMMLHYGAGNPTPPITPPGQGFGNTPRRSSYILGRHMLDAAIAAASPPLPDTASLPPFGHDMGTPRPGRPSEDTNRHTRPSVDFRRESTSKPPLSYMRQHKRQQSSRSYRSKGSHRRWASFQSGMAAQSTIRSFDATSYSGSFARSEVMPPPLRVLRRRPGGDLRGATNIADLDGLPLQRSRSVGSLTTFSDSIRSSYIRSPMRGSCDFVDVVSSNYSQNRGEVFSLGAMADPTPKQPISLFSSHSSKPVVPPSFEAEAQKLAQIPDDADDDGGVESALLKLEGKYQRKIAKLSMEPLKIPAQDLENIRDGSVTPKAELADDEKWKHRHQHVGEEEPVISPIEEDDLLMEKDGQSQAPRHSAVSSFLSEDSRETENSIPLLERGVMDDGPSKPRARAWTNQSILEGPDTPEEMDEGTIANSPLHPSYEFVTKTESMDNIGSGKTASNSDKHQSFLDVDSDRDSELSSEISGEIIEDDDFIPSKPHPPMKNNSSPTRAAPHTTIETRHSSKDGNSSPPISLQRALKLPTEETRSPQLHERQLWSQKPLPPTPDTTPTAAMQNREFDSYSDPTGTRSGPKLAGDMYRKSTAHLPFILAFDSKVLAQQFTLIEKDALNEVDWKELIDMRWKNSMNDSRSWVDFLRNSDARGVEVVIARFNIMVKWAISEIVLTQDIEERARCIIKFLHIAAHCRRIRNFATMSQIVFALTSNEIARLSQTWAMIPPADQKTMSDLENLVSPTKNFYNLRAEMEGGGTTTDPGCIPFVGIYTHDLLFNSQRPSEIASSPTTAPLVNFERCRIAASVVKTLLRLLEASTFYQFQPIEGVTERCLWMGALSDEEIRSRSESLE